LPRHPLSILLLSAALLSPMTMADAKPAATRANPLVDYDGFLKLTREVRPYRAKRLLSLAEFTARARDPKVLVLDARSAQAFAEGHIAGAINLPFPDFTAESLAAVIGPNAKRPIFIYCNNNFSDNARPVVTKLPSLALNNQTFINLYGYGYKNVWELRDAITMQDTRINWVTTTRAP
jgi:phage shock protein E